MKKKTLQCRFPIVKCFRAGIRTQVIWTSLMSNFCWLKLLCLLYILMSGEMEGNNKIFIFKKQSIIHRCHSIHNDELKSVKQSFYCQLFLLLTTGIIYWSPKQSALKLHLGKLNSINNPADPEISNTKNHSSIKSILLALRWDYINQPIELNFN